jgi:hypothetical protein
MSIDLASRQGTEPEPRAGGGPSGDDRSPGRLLRGLLRSMRPKQWIKNCVLLAGLISTLGSR